MDLHSFATSLSSITLYDIKNVYNQAKNVVLNISEMEAKVRDATSDEPWAASSTLQQEIADGTSNFQQFNEIMPCIYGRFMEKEARQWRQIYKALQLLDYLIRHGHERVVDDARSHLSTIRMLQNFQYFDEKGQNKGYNVQTRAREIVELLSDVDKIRTVRRTAKEKRPKTTGISSDSLRWGGSSSSFAGMSRRDTYNSSGSGDTELPKRNNFEVYTAGDDDTIGSRFTSASNEQSTSRANVTITSSLSKQATSTSRTKATEPAVDLLGGLDEVFAAPITTANISTASTSIASIVTDSTSTNTEKALPLVSDDDDFADFQAAPASPQTLASSNPTLMEMLNSSSVAAAPTLTSPISVSKSPVTLPSVVGGASRNLLGSAATHNNTPPNNTLGSAMSHKIASRPLSPTMSSRPSTTVPTSSAAPAAKGLSGFEDLWSMSLASTSSTKEPTTMKSIQALAKEKAEAAIWTQQPASGIRTRPGNMNAVGPKSTNTGTSSLRAGDDDLLL